jgi:hypothetical protein
MMGRSFNSNTPSSDQPTRALSEAEIESRHHLIRTIVFPALKERTNAYNLQMARKHDNHVKIIGPNHFPADSSVMIANDNAHDHESPFIGPFTVIRRTKGGAYQLQDAAGNILPRDVPPSKLKRVDALPGTVPSYEVEAIVNHKGRGKNIKYLVKWKDYPADQNTWEPATSFNSDRPIRQYWRRLRASNSFEGK